MDKQKFEAVIVDLALGDEARAGPAAAPLFARQSDRGYFCDHSRREANFPQAGLDLCAAKAAIGGLRLNQTLRAAFGMVVRERRRYFRCPVGFQPWSGHSNPKISSAKP